jgi:hypothetical protein
MCPKSFRSKVPETGLEPALPLQEPGPQPGMYSTCSHLIRITVTLQVLVKYSTYTLQMLSLHCTHVGPAWPLLLPNCYQISFLQSLLRTVDPAFSLLEFHH